MKKSHTVLYTYKMRVHKNMFIDPRSVGIRNMNGDGLTTPNLYLNGIISACSSVVLNTSVLCAQPITFQSAHLCLICIALPKIPLNRILHMPLEYDGG